MTERRPQVPTVAELLAAVRAFVADVAANATGEQRYQAQVAGYLLSICERELTTDATLVPVSNTDALCAAIRAGEHDTNWRTLLDDLLSETAAVVEITRPDLLAPLHRTTP